MSPADPQGTPRNPFRVSQLLAVLKGELAERFPWVAVEAELGQLSQHPSGHWYFTLVDFADDGPFQGQATLNAAMFRGDNQRVRWRPRTGDRVLAIGGFDIYAPAGRLSFVARRLEPSGAGARARQLEELRRRLAEEGLFSSERKRRLPLLPRAVGVATASTGAALHDILEVTWRRFPGMPVILAPCRVQGEGAAPSIVEALALLQEHGRCEVVIVGRGGGSAEDLWAFNDEALVRAVAACRVPVVSAVGHETDDTLCDLAADLRAPTPSAAAAAVVPERDALAMHLDEQVARAQRAARRTVEQFRARVQRLRPTHPGDRLARSQERLVALEGRQQAAAVRKVERSRARLAQAAGRLDALSPLAVLTRGYAIARKDHLAVRTPSDVTVGDRLELLLAEGVIPVEVVDDAVSRAAGPARSPPK